MSLEKDRHKAYCGNSHLGVLCPVVQCHVFNLETPNGISLRQKNLQVNFRSRSMSPILCLVWVKNKAREKLWPLPHNTREFEKTPIFLQLSLTSIIIRQENVAFRKRSSNLKNLRFSGDGNHFEKTMTSR